MIADDGFRQPRIVRERAQLEQQAFLHRARTDTVRLEGMEELQHIDERRTIDPDASRCLFGRLRQESVLVDHPDQVAQRAQLLAREPFGIHLAEQEILLIGRLRIDELLVVAKRARPRARPAEHAHFDSGAHNLDHRILERDLIEVRAQLGRRHGKHIHRLHVALRQTEFLGDVLGLLHDA